MPIPRERAFQKGHDHEGCRARLRLAPQSEPSRKRTAQLRGDRGVSEENFKRAKVRRHWHGMVAARAGNGRKPPAQSSRNQGAGEATVPGTQHNAGDAGGAAASRTGTQPLPTTGRAGRELKE